MRTVWWYLEVVHQAVLTASLLADGEVVAQRAGCIGAVHRVAHRVVLVARGFSDDAGSCRRRSAVIAFKTEILKVR